MSEAQLTAMFWSLINLATLVIAVMIYNLLHPYRKELCPMCGNIILRSEPVGQHGECPACVERKKRCPLKIPPDQECLPGCYKCFLEDHYGGKN
jgi:hypothetical protein